jgi:flagellar biosynthesis chaperone FliJ
MPVFTYRVQPLLDQRNKLKEEAAQNLFSKKQQLREATEKLIELERQVKVLAQKKNQLQLDLLVGGPTGLSGIEVRRRYEYLGAVGLDLETAKDAVFSQKMFIEDCNREVAAAQIHLTRCSRDVEVLQKHRDKLEQRFLRELEKKEALELDEIGNMMHRKAPQ